MRLQQQHHQSLSLPNLGTAPTPARASTRRHRRDGGATRDDTPRVRHATTTSRPPPPPIFNQVVVAHTRAVSATAHLLVADTNTRNCHLPSIALARGVKRPADDLSAAQPQTPTATPHDDVPEQASSTRTADLVEEPSSSPLQRHHRDGLSISFTDLESVIEGERRRSELAQRASAATSSLGTEASLASLRVDRTATAPGAARWRGATSSPSAASSPAPSMATSTRYSGGGGSRRGIYRSMPEFLDFNDLDALTEVMSGGCGGGGGDDDDDFASSTAAGGGSVIEESLQRIRGSWRARWREALREHGIDVRELDGGDGDVDGYDEEEEEEDEEGSFTMQVIRALDAPLGELFIGGDAEGDGSDERRQLQSRTSWMQIWSRSLAVGEQGGGATQRRQRRHFTSDGGVVDHVPPGPAEVEGSVMGHQPWRATENGYGTRVEHPAAEVSQGPAALDSASYLLGKRTAEERRTVESRDYQCEPRAIQSRENKIEHHRCLEPEFSLESLLRRRGLAVQRRRTGTTVPRIHRQASVFDSPAARELFPSEKEARERLLLHQMHPDAVSKYPDLRTTLHWAPASTPSKNDNLATVPLSVGCTEARESQPADISARFPKRLVVVPFDATERLPTPPPLPVSLHWCRYLLRSRMNRRGGAAGIGSEEGVVKRSMAHQPQQQGSRQLPVTGWGHTMSHANERVIKEAALRAITDEHCKMIAAKQARVRVLQELLVNWLCDGSSVKYAAEILGLKLVRPRRPPRQGQEHSVGDAERNQMSGEQKNLSSSSQWRESGGGATLPPLAPKPMVILMKKETPPPVPSPPPLPPPPPMHMQEELIPDPDMISPSDGPRLHRAAEADDFSSSISISLADLMEPPRPRFNKVDDIIMDDYNIMNWDGVVDRGNVKTPFTIFV